MKKKDQRNQPKKSISNLEDQSINADKVQGGLKIRYENITAKRDSFATHDNLDESTSGPSSDSLSGVNVVPSSEAKPRHPGYKISKTSK